MPSLSRTIAWMLIAAWPAGLVAQAWSPEPEEPAPSRFPVVQAEFLAGLESSEAEAASIEAPSHAEPAASPPLSPPGQKEPLPKLSPPGRSGREKGAAAGGLSKLLTVGSSLAVVLGLFLVVAWFLRRAAPGGSGLLPSGAVEVLGRAALGGRHQVHLVRCGNKLLLVSVSTAGVETLTEITDADEIGRLEALCRQGKPDSASQVFRQVFQQMAGERKWEGADG